LLTLYTIKSVILCGDFKVAHKVIDLKNFTANRGNYGFTEEERGKMTYLLLSGFVDSLRHFYSDTGDLYSWWSYMKTVRERNIGWRIDYFIVSERIAKLMQDAQIHAEVMGSDHCQIMMKINL